MIAARELSDRDRLRFNYFAMEAMSQRQKGNDAAAMDLFRHALEINPDADEIAYALSGFYSGDGGDDSLYLAYLNRAIELNPSNSTYQSEMAAHYISEENYSKAAEILEQQYAKGINKSNTLDVLIRLYYATGDYPKALDALTRFETKEGKSLTTTLRRIQISEATDDTLAAYEALKSLADENEDIASYKIMLGNWLIQKGKTTEAGPYLEAALQQAPDDYDALMSLYDYYRATNQDSLSQDIADRVLRSANTPIKDRVRFMGNCLHSIYNQGETGDTLGAFNFLNKLIEENPNDSLAAYLRVSLMQTLEYPSDSIALAMEEYFQIVPDDPSMRLQQAQLYASENNWVKTRQAAQIGQEYNPDELVFYYFNAICLLQSDRDNDAIRVIKDGLKKRGEGTNNELVADCFSLLGDLQYQAGDLSQAFMAYDSCLVYNPKSTGALNNYAYYLSLMNRDLKKAEAMSYQTIKEEPNNGTYLDTYAWILFQQGRYDDAQTYIDRTLQVAENDARDELILMNTTDSVEVDSVEISEALDSIDSNDSIDTNESIDSIYSPTPEEIHQAVVDNPSNATLFEHAGDISYMNGNTKQALRHWNDAALCKKPDKTLQKKIKKQRYIPRKSPKL